MERARTSNRPVTTHLVATDEDIGDVLLQPPGQQPSRRAPGYLGIPLVLRVETHTSRESISIEDLVRPSKSLVEGTIPERMIGLQSLTTKSLHRSTLRTENTNVFGNLAPHLRRL